MFSNFPEPSHRPNLTLSLVLFLHLRWPRFRILEPLSFIQRLRFSSSLVWLLCHLSIGRKHCAVCLLDNNTLPTYLSTYFTRLCDFNSSYHSNRYLHART